MKKLSIILLLALTVLPLTGQAKALIFIQGYEENGSEWRTHGVTVPLLATGWSDGGHLFDRGFGITVPTHAKGADQFYTVALPTEAPLMLQMQILARYVDAVNLGHPGESLILAGHSVGGVLGRLYMVKNPHVPVAGLVTIASPHRGTGLSEAGVILGQTPLSWGLPFIGADSINRSQGLLYDLRREAPINFLFGLNRDLHPVSRYLSVIRNDWVVSPESQEMRFVAALINSDLTETVFSTGDHDLNPDDGRILVGFLATVQ